MWNSVVLCSVWQRADLSSSVMCTASLLSSTPSAVDMVSACSRCCVAAALKWTNSSHHTRSTLVGYVLSPQSTPSGARRLRWQHCTWSRRRLVSSANNLSQRRVTAKVTLSVLSVDADKPVLHLLHLTSLRCQLRAHCVHLLRVTACRL